MHTRRRKEGWLSVDHRDSPGVNDNEMIGFNPDFWPGAGRGLTEAPIVICCHCQATRVIKPDRSRDFPYCRSCDDDLCDDCAWAMKVTGVHQSFKQARDAVFEAAMRGSPIPIFQRPAVGPPNGYIGLV